MDKAVRKLKLNKEKKIITSEIVGFGERKKKHGKEKTE
jgi:hypothetical protein